MIYENHPEHRKITLAASLRLKILSDTGINTTDELHFKKNRGQPPKVKMKKTDRVVSTYRHADTGIPLRSPQVNDEFSSQPEINPGPPVRDKDVPLNLEVNPGPPRPRSGTNWLIREIRIKE